MPARDAALRLPEDLPGGPSPPTQPAPPRPRRRPWSRSVPRALLALAIGAFGIGTTEFVVMGMLPEIADGLGVSVSAVGLLISAYAVGVVVGAPTLTALGVRFPPRRTLVALMVVFVVGNTLSALAPTYETLVAARVLTALVHGAFFGVGAVAARRLVPPERATQAIALMITGLTLANVVGVPLGTLVGEEVGGRLGRGGGRPRPAPPRGPAGACRAPGCPTSSASRWGRSSRSS